MTRMIRQLENERNCFVKYINEINKLLYNDIPINIQDFLNKWKCYIQITLNN